MNEKTYAKIAVMFFAFVLAWAVTSTGLLYYTTRKYNQLGESTSELTRQLTDARDTNTRLGDQLEECRSVTAALGDTVGRSATTAREAIEICEELREEVGYLQNIFDSDWQRSYYDNLDNDLGIK